MRVEFKSVLFTYPSRPGQLILNKLNLTFEGGQKVALVGESGSGKSTCMQLFLKFYNADAGELLIHGPSGPVNINTIPAAKWRQLIGYVGQEPVLFKGSIYDNVTSRDDSVPLEDVIWAIKTAEAAEFVKDKAREAAQNKSKDSKKSSGSEYVDVEEEDKLIAKGLKTVLGQGGGGLSGGQKQRIAIARAIVLRGKRKMLLLDEATSALDNKTEFEVQGTIDNVVAEQKMTTISIAHRLSTIQSSDKIFVMQRGEVMDHGTHEELIADEGAMRR
jgi:ABC-type multidrug transport system fused ATPase/permease subunit